MPETAATASVLIVDDNQQALRALEYVLGREGMRVDCASSGAQALTRIHATTYDAVVCDLSMPGMTGLELLRTVRASDARLPVLILTAHGTVESAVEALRDGACDYLQKPFHSPDIVARLRAAMVRRDQPAPTPTAPPTPREAPDGDIAAAFLGTSPPMRKLVEQIRTLAGKDITVMLQGESGTGKELAARALHHGGPRRPRAFVAVNCASIPETLLENELFGHVKGAYTGAHGHHKGLFEEAHQGTIFLDEIGEIPLSLQAKLLRVLQEQEFKKIGGTRDIQVDVRVITATNRDLRQAVAEGRFREDLYYRINVVPIRLPPLRERSEDIPLLAHHFRNLFNAELGLAARGFTDDALARLVNHPWPGNVRELRNRIKMALVMAKATMITVEDLALEDQGELPVFPPFQEAKNGFERDYVIRALKLCGGNVKRAAEIAGRDRSTFYDLLKKHAVTAENYRHLYA